ncbi:MAG: hypothetical protein JNL72_03905 [Flavipsychrobacter sp.]|nr:hypothetical protein [Flavipsychrobacter sp.]
MSLISKWKEKLAQGIGEKLDTIKLDFIDKTSGILGYVLYSLVALFIALSVFLFSGLGLSEVFADVFRSRAGGYFATAGVFAIIIACLFIFRQKIVDAFAGIFIRILTQQDDENKDAPQP